MKSHSRDLFLWTLRLYHAVSYFKFIYLYIIFFISMSMM